VEIPAAGNTGLLTEGLPGRTLNLQFTLINNKIQLIDSNDILSGNPNTVTPGKTFEKMYIASRRKESRVYSDDQVVLLPSIETSHVHYHEWQVRKRSASRLFKYLENKDAPRSILEVGCGNGWLSAKLAELKNSNVTGIDINSVELYQAKKVFSDRINMNFAEGDLENAVLECKFDAIVFAASIQYFRFFDQVIGKALTLLNHKGEIHILDSQFYHDKDLEQARMRSQSYYDSIGYGEMAKFYFHHRLDSIKKFQYKLLYNPSSIKNRIFSKRDPFPWLRISNI
jgi:ubiquinone/menaquinone biosynthesis C-methylase UbiE